MWCGARARPTRCVCRRCTSRALEARGPGLRGHPDRELLFAQLTARERQNCPHLVGFVWVEPVAIQSEKYGDGHNCDALVAVHERMIPRQTESIRCGQTREI